MKKYNNKILITVVIVLVITFALSRIFRAPKRESNLREQLMAIDTSAITEIKILYPGALETILSRSKKEPAWKVTEGDRTANADTLEVRDALRMASNIEIKGLVSQKKEQWDAFNISDSSAIKVSLYTEAGKETTFMIGKIGFAQNKIGLAQNKNKGVYTHVRLASEDEIYSTEGFLTPYFNKDFNNWRNKTVLQLDKKDITKVVFNYPDSSFVLEKKDSTWYVDNQPADSTGIELYLIRLEKKDIANFDDAFIPQEPALQTIQIENHGELLAVLKAWPKKEDEWIISSSLQEGVYFRDAKGLALKELFVGKSMLSK